MNGQNNLCVTVYEPKNGFKMVFRQSFDNCHETDVPTYYCKQGLAPPLRFSDWPTAL